MNERKCPLYNCVKGELHFIAACLMNETHWELLYQKVCHKFEEFCHLNNVQKLIFIGIKKMINCISTYIPSICGGYICLLICRLIFL